MKKIFIPEFTHAGRWVYNGFANAWDRLGYSVIRSDDQIYDAEWAMLTDLSLIANIDLEKFEKVFLFCSLSDFEYPYSMHQNFCNTISKNKIAVDRINEMDHVVQWTFLNFDGHPKRDDWWYWKKLNYVPLAFDNIAYTRNVNEDYQYDVCFVGGYANNGFNTKIQIMKEIISYFMGSDLKCGFFINKNLSHEQEEQLLSSSKVCLNIHDEYQRKIGLDINERTFKSLGLNGSLVSDYVKEGRRMFGNMFVDDEFIFDNVKKAIHMSEEERQYNRENIMKNHTYEERCKILLSV